MGLGAYAILIIFGAFVLLLVVNPNMSCFGKRIRSPFYPLLRKRRIRKPPSDHRFRPVDDPAKPPGGQDGPKPAQKTEDYGFRLD